MDLDPASIHVEAAKRAGEFMRRRIWTHDGEKVNIQLFEGSVDPYYRAEGNVEGWPKYPQRTHILLHLGTKEGDAMRQILCHVKGKDHRVTVENDVTLNVSHKEAKIVDMRGHDVNHEDLQGREFETAVVCPTQYVYKPNMTWYSVSINLLFLRVRDRVDPNSWLTFL